MTIAPLVAAALSSSPDLHSNWLDMGRSPCCAKDGIKRGPWAPEEDQMLVDYIKQHGHGNWRTLAKKAGLARCGKSCRLRWTNYLRPDIKRGSFSSEEEDTIIHLHSVLGNKWSAIAARLPGRTDNEIKNYWNTHLRKRLLRMGIDPVTHTPRLDLLDLPSLLASSSSVFLDPAAAELDLLQNIATGLLSAQNSNMLHHNRQLGSNSNPELQEAYQQISATCKDSMILDEAQLMMQRLDDPWHDHFTMHPNPSVDYQGTNPFHSRQIVDGGFDTYWTYSQLSSVLSTPASSSSTHMNSSLTSRSSEGGRESDCCDPLEFQLPDLLNMSNYI